MYAETLVNANTLQTRTGDIIMGLSSLTLSAPSAANYTLTFPGGQGAANEVMKNDGSGSLSWGAGGGTPFKSGLITSATNLTAADTGTTYLLNSDGGGFTIVLPALADGLYFRFVQEGVNSSTMTIRTNNVMTDFLFGHRTGESTVGPITAFSDETQVRFLTAMATTIAGDAVTFLAVNQAGGFGWFTEIISARQPTGQGIVVG